MATDDDKDDKPARGAFPYGGLPMPGPAPADLTPYAGEGPQSPEEFRKVVEEQNERDRAALAHLRSLRRLLSVGGLAGVVLVGLVVWKLYNWHIAGWAGLPELPAAAAIGAVLIVRLCTSFAAPNERLEGAYSNEHRVQMASQSIGVMLGWPLIALAIGWLLKILL